MISNHGTITQKVADRLKIEECSDNMKTFQTVKFMKMRNSCKVSSQIENIENHSKKKFSLDVSATHPIQLTLQ